MTLAERPSVLPLEPAEFQEVAVAVRRRVGEVIVGQEEAVTGVLLCLLVGRHALLEGVPGLGKTSLVRAFSRVLGVASGRIQCTPDLMPADITGTNVLSQHAGGPPTVAFTPGPVFTNLLLADEINRATPKTQSALLEAMEEGTVTVANATHRLPRPFCVLATQNPIEAHGTYPLPEAQLDRFLLKLHFRLPDRRELNEIVANPAPEPATDPVLGTVMGTVEGTGAGTLMDTGAGSGTDPVADGPLLERMRRLVHAVPMGPHVVDYASRLTLALHPDSPDAPEPVRRSVRYGPSPRGAQALCLAGRALALIDGRYSLAYRDVRAVSRQALRHRLVLNLAAERDGVSADSLVEQTLARLPEEPP